MFQSDQQRRAFNWLVFIIVLSVGVVLSATFFIVGASVWTDPFQKDSKGLDKYIGPNQLLSLFCLLAYSLAPIPIAMGFFFKKIGMGESKDEFSTVKRTSYYKHFGSCGGACCATFGIGLLFVFVHSLLIGYFSMFMHLIGIFCGIIVGVTLGIVYKCCIKSKKDDL